MGVMYFPDEVPEEANKNNSSCFIRGCLGMFICMIMLLIYVIYCVLRYEPPKQAQIDVVEQLSVQTTSQNKGVAGCEISEVWLDDNNVRDINLYGDSVAGFYIHLNLKIENHTGEVFKVQAFFYDNNGGKYIRGKSAKYQASENSAYVQINVEAAYKVSRWKNLTLFVPYEELDCKGNTYITCMVLVRDKSNKEFARNEVLKFYFTP